MPDKNSSQKSTELSFVAELCDRYGRYPLLQALLRLIPYWGTADTLMRERIKEIEKERARVFFDELAEDGTELTRELIDQDDFLHCFWCAFRAALRTRRKEKIRMFSRLLRSGTSQQNRGTVDEFEELLCILEEISLREFEVLRDLRTYERTSATTQGPAPTSDFSVRRKARVIRVL